MAEVMRVEVADDKVEKDEGVKVQVNVKEMGEGDNGNESDDGGVFSFTNNDTS